MRKFFSLFLTLLAIAGYGQNALQPAQVIQEMQKAGSRFEAFQLFTTSVSTRSHRATANCSSCAVFSVEKNQINKLLAERPERITLQLPSFYRSSIELELYAVDLYANGLIIETGSGINTDEVEEGIHYRGVVKGTEQSLAAVSVFEDDVMILMSTPDQGNLVVAQLEDTPGQYLFYAADEFQDGRHFDCQTPDTYRPYSAEELQPQTAVRGADACVKIFLEVDNDIYLDKGGMQGTVNYISGLFNQNALLYANENINMIISKLFIWDTSSPYKGSDSYAMLNQFQNRRTTIDGDLGQLLSYQASGGIAVVDGLCERFTAYKLSFASIGRSYKEVPNYSFTVMVMAHELGHLLGSQHTHACVWNNNGTALDGCAGYVEGNCSTPGIPQDGGTVMSYCHLTSAGINLTKGFGQQPGNLIRNKVAGSACLETCVTQPPNDGGGGGNDGNTGCVTVTFTLTLDVFGAETSWELLNANNAIIDQGSGYNNKEEGKVITKSFCLPSGCYTLRVKDSAGDGICCTYGEGSFSLVHEDGTQLFAGGDFGFEQRGEFCVEASGDGGGGNPELCSVVNFRENAPIPYGRQQDQGKFDVFERGTGIYLFENAWKAIKFPYTVTRQTMLRFEYQSTAEPEVGGIGLDENTQLSSSRCFTLTGTQAWGIRAFNNYKTGQGWKTYEIPIGKYFTGQMNYLFFTADHDQYPKDGNSYFRNVVVYEGSLCSNLEGLQTGNLPATPTGGAKIFPNPANQQVTIELDQPTDRVQQLEVYNMYGQRVKAVRIEQELVRIQLSTAELPNGTYLYRLGGNESEYTGKFNVHR